MMRARQMYSHRDNVGGDKGEAIPFKERLARRFARRQLGSIEHEQSVVAIADALFSLTEPFHRLTNRDRRLLRMAAWLHDVGRRHDDKNHPTIGAEMIRRDKRLQLTARQRRALMYLTRHHRGVVPKAGYDDILRRGDGRRDLRLVLALLRAADTLDNRQLNSPTVKLSRQGKTLLIICEIDHPRDWSRAQKAFGRRKKFQLLEEVLGISVKVDIRESKGSATISSR